MCGDKHNDTQDPKAGRQCVETNTMTHLQVCGDKYDDTTIPKQRLTMYGDRYDTREICIVV